MTVETEMAADAVRSRGPLVYRQSAWTRLTHWTWAVSLFFLLLTGLQIFNAHPALYVGHQSGFEFENALLDIHAERKPTGEIIGVTTILGHTFETTGVLGASGGTPEKPDVRAFPAWATIPSYHDLATGRVVHFFFAWVLVATLAVWFLASLVNGHLRRDLVPGGRDFSNLSKDLRDHLRLKFHHTKSYNVLQKFAYGGVLFVAFPLIVLTGLTMSPGMNAIVPWLVEVFGGRQTARTIHFLCMAALVLFFVVHMLMVLAAGPFNELRSIVTGWYRTDPEPKEPETRS